MSVTEINAFIHIISFDFHINPTLKVFLKSGNVDIIILYLDRLKMFLMFWFSDIL